jgi:hypothetical protein
MEIKIVEEWGYAMGEDTCLFAEEDESGSSQADEDVAKDVPEVGRNVDVLVDNLVNVEEDEEGVGVQRQSGDETPYNNASAAGDSKEQESWNDEVLSPALDQPEAQLELSVGNQGGSTFSRISASSPMSASQGSLTCRLNGGLTGQACGVGHAVHVLRHVLPLRIVRPYLGRGVGSGYEIIIMRRRV